MTKNKESINLEQLKIIRNRATQLSDKLATTEKTKQDLTLNLINIYDNCGHELVVRYKDNQVGRIVRCLCCTKTFYGLIVGLDCYFENLVDFPEFLQEKDVMQFVLNLFEEEKTRHPGISDAEIVAIINEQLKNQRVPVEEQILVKNLGTK